MQFQSRVTVQPHPPAAPLQVVKEQPWSFVVLCLGLGLAAGVLLRVVSFRKLLRGYLLLRALI